ncbi:MAG: hypothetical protein JXB23_08220, partial [Candidatus Aminicenantes bacterium]|nr:hypothetical protein [Candidatus Aminicenantes bacterium]
MKIKTGIFIVWLVICASLSAASAIEQGEEFKIFQTDQRMKVDGKLDDWRKVEGIPIVKTPVDKIVEPSSDLTVTAFFSFDTKNFYAAVKVRDDMLEYPSRSWRYGDGFYLTFLDPYKGEESDRFYTFGFSREEKQDVKVLVNKDGEYFPALEINDIELAIERDEKKGSIVYELAIPWETIPPLMPFIHDEWEINLIYIDRDQGKRKQVLQLHADQAYDTEITKLRKGAVVRFEKHVPQYPELQATFNATHFFNDDEKILTLAINSPIDMTNWKIRYELSSAKKNLSFNEDLAFKKGMNFIKHKVENLEESSGTYVLSLAVIDDANSLKFRSDHSFFVVNREEFQEFKAKSVEAKKSESYKEDEIFKASLPTYEIRLEWLEEFMEDAQPFADVHPLQLWMEELESLSKKIEEGKPSLFPPGQIVRLAHRSSIDGTLQPYSIFVPPTYTGQYSIPLFVTLHGSGVDERNTIFYAARLTSRRGHFIILAPRARGLSDWYLG